MLVKTLFSFSIRALNTIELMVIPFITKLFAQTNILTNSDYFIFLPFSNATRVPFKKNEIAGKEFLTLHSKNRIPQHRHLLQVKMYMSFFLFLFDFFHILYLKRKVKKLYLKAKIKE